MVLGGIGLRRELSFDALDDLQLAVDSVLEGDSTVGKEPLNMTVALGEDTLTISLEALRDSVLKATLSEGQVPAGAEGKCIDVCILLNSLVDSYQVRELDSERYAVEMHRSVR
jgi:hypothetical protein